MPRIRVHEPYKWTSTLPVTTNMNMLHHHSGYNLAVPLQDVICSICSHSVQRDQIHYFPNSTVIVKSQLNWNGCCGAAALMYLVQCSHWRTVHPSHERDVSPSWEKIALLCFLLLFLCLFFFFKSCHIYTKTRISDATAAPFTARDLLGQKRQVCCLAFCCKISWVLSHHNS